MLNHSLKKWMLNIGCNKKLQNFEKKQGSCLSFVYSVLNRYQSDWKEVGRDEKNALEETYEDSQVPERPKGISKTDLDSGFSQYSSDDDDLSDKKWKLELAWLTKTLEPALQLYRWALPTGSRTGHTLPPSSRSVSEILASIQRSKVGIQGWSLTDLTVGLYLIYLRQASANTFEHIKGVEVSSESTVQDLLYHIELAKGSYKGSAARLARTSMLQERNVIKFVKESSVMRPGYYIGIDTRRKLVVLGIRGTQTIYDIITGFVTTSDKEITADGYSTHFGTAEAARWFLNHEMGTIKKCLDMHEGFRVRLVGHSLGGATASLLAIMLRKKSSKELGFNPGIVSAIGYGTPPCVSSELAEDCADFVITVVMQDDIVPRLSAASLMRLRNEILQTDWMSVLDKGDWKNILDLFTNAKHMVTSVQDVARKLADYANLRSKTNSPEITIRKGLPPVASSVVASKEEDVNKTVEELFVPGTVYFLKRNADDHCYSYTKNRTETEYFTLWKRHPGEHFQTIVLSNNLFSDHKCDSHYYALRDVLKGLPGSPDEDVFR